MGGGALTEAIGFGFECCVLDDGKAGAERVSHTPRALLDDMSQFMAEQLLAVRGVGLKAAGGEIDIGADREGDCTDPLGLRPDMHAHSRKTRRRVQPPSCRVPPPVTAFRHPRRARAARSRLQMRHHCRVAALHPAAQQRLAPADREIS